VKVLTGDNDLVTRKVCREVGLKADDILLGARLKDDRRRVTGALRPPTFAAIARAQAADHPGAPT
jgi:Mg2+-importing ATPase